MKIAISLTLMTSFRFSLLFGLFFVSACNYNGARDRKPLSPAPPTTAPNEEEIKNITADQIDFTLIQKTVLEPSCIRCHKEGKNKGDVNLEKYENVIKHLKAIEKDILDGSMPPNQPLSPAVKELMLKWLKAGAPLTKTSQPVVKVDETSRMTVSEKEIYTRGEYLFNLSSCDICHTLDKDKPLAGGKALVTDFGTFYTTNISKDKKTGIGNWSPKDFLRAMREGVSPQGEYYYPTFPYTNYSKMSDDDILAIRFYIMNLPETVQPNRPHELKIPFSYRDLLYFWRKFNFPEQAQASKFSFTLRSLLQAWRTYFFPSQQTNDNYLISKGPFQPLPEKGAEWNRGLYLVEGPLHCTVCHTPRGSLLGGVKRKAWMSGSTDSGEAFPAPNITPDYETGLRNWNEVDWMHFLNMGKNPSGHAVTGEMRKIIRYGTSQMTEADKKAVIKYLMSLKPVKNQEIFDIIRNNPKSSENNEDETIRASQK